MIVVDPSRYSLARLVEIYDRLAAIGRALDKAKQIRIQGGEANQAGGEIVTASVGSSKEVG
jgi:hypothetical protein